jgi:hypothetical protein
VELRVLRFFFRSIGRAADVCGQSAYAGMRAPWVFGESLRIRMFSIMRCRSTVVSRMGTVMAVVPAVMRGGLSHLATYETEPQRSAHRGRLSEAAPTARAARNRRHC